MGFIPIFITLGGSVLLFILVVSQGIKSKRSQFSQFCQLTWKGLEKYNLEKKDGKKGFEELRKKFLEAKSKLNTEDLLQFDIEVRKPFQQAKIIQSQHNLFIAKKPYSFIAKLMGFQAI
ncbi:hypothetical protein Belba_3375 [Belliella baltica DSM 15883]|uniref:Uncharacterized protein n=1 Tax=Belliella baltica (strain DSM 15883 / CIP 108006 / LMG 21964 / BA134) TaxID=866536 RepID=I3Z9G0_BELBD|nr:hypothetical protein [Belliella baltica]AFL85878.1 hypothetical protein Belba_3375 [Belliella baltica DSM 15883]